MSVQSIPLDSIRTLLETASRRLAAFQPGVVSDRPYYEGRVAALHDLLAVRGDVAIATEIMARAETECQFAARHHLSESTRGYAGGRVHAVRDALRRGGIAVESQEAA